LTGSDGKRGSDIDGLLLTIYALRIDGSILGEDMKRRRTVEGDRQGDGQRESGMGKGGKGRERKWWKVPE